MIRELPEAAPRHPQRHTFNRLFAALEPQRFLEVFMRWTLRLREVVVDEVVALNGKALPRAIDSGNNPEVIVSAWAAGNGLVLGQRKVAEKDHGRFSV